MIGEIKPYLVVVVCIQREQIAFNFSSRCGVVVIAVLLLAVIL
jgi:hypothetical protein